MDVLFSTGADEHERDQWLAALRIALPEVRWYLPGTDCPRDAIQWAVVANPPFGTLQGLPRLRLIQSLWAGVDSLLNDPTLPPDVPIARMVDPTMVTAMTETALWACLSLHRHFYAYQQAQRDRRWLQRPQRRAGDIRVVVLGLGQMGRATARCLSQLGYSVTGWRQSAHDSVDDIPSVAGTAALRPLLGQCEILINLLPLTESTRGLLNRDLFAALKPGAGLVNLGRGAQVIDGDLLDALSSGQVAHAVLDVFDIEPLPDAHPYWTHPSVTVLPHVAALTDIGSAAAIVAANLRTAMAGGAVAHRVDRRRGY